MTGDLKERSATGQQASDFGRDHDIAKLYRGHGFSFVQQGTWRSSAECHQVAMLVPEARRLRTAIAILPAEPGGSGARAEHPVVQRQYVGLVFENDIPTAEGQFANAHALVKIHHAVSHACFKVTTPCSTPCCVTSRLMLWSARS
ncbi:MAG: hypothetical protein AW10_03302 [Candidatus Accumulibacter appositus]|uniref:Uncharacterized protein n=1 Tax=Candidatus Accumulibacter appositus TaxID=1454003 RepID=A0A011PM69_9PROT|nr:MAG: hypothetical protein AW10_03302 [Candidatus Accumulibacter appositus]